MNNVSTKSFSRRMVMGAAVLAAGAVVMNPSMAQAVSSNERELINLINKDRVAKGAPKLVIHEEISKVSQASSDSMANKGKMESDSKYITDKRVPSDWISASQVVAQSTYSNSGSIYYQIMNGNSVNHLLDKRFNTAGIGMKTSKSGTTYITISLFEYKKNTAPAPKQTFTDVPKSLIFYDEIEELANKGITTGWYMKNGTQQYRPFSNVKRDAMIVFIYRAMGSPAYTPPKKSPFTDVKTNNVFYKEIAWAYDTGIAEGWKMKNGTRQFRPLQNVKRDAVAAFLMRAAGEKAPVAKTAPFSDVPTSLIFADEIKWMKDTGISTGWKHNNTYQPFSNTKRDAMAAFMVRWMNYTGYNGS